MSSPSSTFVAHQLALEPNAETQEQVRPSAATALPPGPGITSEPTVIGPAAPAATIASVASQQPGPAQPDDATASPPVSATAVVSETTAATRSASLEEGQTTANGPVTTPTSVSSTAAATTSSSSSASSISSSSSPSPAPESNSANGAFASANTVTYSTGSAPAFTPSPPASSWSAASSWSPPAQQSNTWQETGWTDSWSSAVGAPTSAPSSAVAAAVFSDSFSTSSSAVSVTPASTTDHTASIPPPPSGTSLVLASSESATTKSDSTSAGALGAEDSAGSSTKQGMSGGAIAGLVIAILLMIGLAGCIWQRKRKRSQGDGHSSFWGRFFNREDEEDDSFGEKGYNRQEDDALPIADALSQRDKNRSTRNSQDDGASSFYVPSKSTKNRPPIESEYFGSGNYPTVESEQFSGPGIARVSQSSWLGPPPGIENLVPSVAKPSFDIHPQPSTLAVARPASNQHQHQNGRQSIPQAGYGAHTAYDYPGNEVLQDEVLVGKDRANRESLSSYYSNSDVETVGGQRNRNTGIDSIYSTWGNASSVGGRSAVSSSYGPWNDRRPRSTRSSRVPERKSTLKKSWTQQGDQVRQMPQTLRLSRSGAPLPSQAPAPQAQMPKKPFSALAATPVAVKNNIGFMASAAPPMPLGWGNRA